MFYLFSTMEGNGEVWTVVDWQRKQGGGLVSFANDRGPGAEANSNRRNASHSLRHVRRFEIVQGTISILLAGRKGSNV